VVLNLDLLGQVLKLRPRTMMMKMPCSMGWAGGISNKLRQRISFQKKKKKKNMCKLHAEKDKEENWMQYDCSARTQEVQTEDG
jgi:hypothetical protein